jgi:hypothetical protein
VGLESVVVEWRGHAFGWELSIEEEKERKGKREEAVAKRGISDHRCWGL